MKIHEYVKKRTLLSDAVFSFCIYLYKIILSQYSLIFCEYSLYSLDKGE